MPPPSYSGERTPRCRSLSDRACGPTTGAGDVADVARRLGTPPWDPLGAPVEPWRPRARWWWVATSPLPIGASTIVFLPEFARQIAIVAVIIVLVSWWGLSIRAAVSSTREPRERWAYALTAVALVWAVGGVALAAMR